MSPKGTKAPRVEDHYSRAGEATVKALELQRLAWGWGILKSRAGRTLLDASNPAFLLSAEETKVQRELSLLALLSGSLTSIRIQTWILPTQDSFIIPEALILFRLEDPYLVPKKIWFGHVLIVVLLVPIDWEGTLFPQPVFIEYPLFCVCILGLCVTWIVVDSQVVVVFLFFCDSPLSA